MQASVYTRTVIYISGQSHGHFAKKSPSRARSVNPVNVSDTEDLFLGYFDTDWYWYQYVEYKEE